MLWAFLSIISGFGDAIMFALMKKLKGINNSMIVWTQHFFALPFLLILLYFNYPQNINFNVYWTAFLNSVLLLISTYLLVKATQISKLSISMPMLSFTPLFLIVTSYIMINELPTFYGFFGILLIVIGAYVIHIGDYKKGFFEPIRTLFTDKGSFYVILVAFIWAVTANLFKIGIIGSNPIFFSVLVYLIISIIMFPLLFVNFNNKTKDLKLNFNKLMLLGIASAFVIVTASFAMLTAIVPYVISLKRSSIIFAIFFGYLFFNEKNIGNALIGTIIMLIGGVLVTLF